MGCSLVSLERVCQPLRECSDNERGGEVSHCTDLYGCISQLCGLCCQGGLVRCRVGISVMSGCGPDDPTKQAMLNLNGQ